MISKPGVYIAIAVLSSKVLDLQASMLGGKSSRESKTGNLNDQSMTRDEDQKMYYYIYLN